MYYEIAKNFLDDESPDKDQKIIQWYQRHSVRDGMRLLQEIEKQAKQRIAKNNRNQYIYMVTFTIDPKLHAKPNVAKIEEFIEAQARRKGLEVYECYYARETHKDGRPHWHVCMKTYRPLRSDAFIHYTKHYGRVDISRTKIQDDSELRAYITKESSVKKIQLVGS